LHSLQNRKNTIPIDLPQNITIDAEFGEQLSEWICSTNLQHVMLCIHEGTHLLYARMCGYEPEVYGPSDKTFYRKGVGWRRTLGSVDGPPPEIFLTADVLIIGKFFLGPAYIEEKLLGEDHWKEIWNRARGDFEKYRNWRRQFVGDMLDAEGLPLLSCAKIRKAVYKDFSEPTFRQRLILAAREYERRVFGPMSPEPVGNGKPIGESQ
jgi:hypothetical protein